MARLRGLKVIPGMPVEVFVETDSRTVLSYLIKPLADQVMRTFRDG
jgi:HlyD family secretion protein